MSEIKKLIDEIGIISFENNMKIAAFAVLSASREIAYQTDNWDVSKYRGLFFDVFKEREYIQFNNIEFLIKRASENVIIGANSQGMGFVIIIQFQGGLLATYALSGADPETIITFLKPYVMELQNKL